MSRYIDSEKFDCVAFKGIPDGYKDTFADGVLYALNRIDEQPTVDAVKVVRCKDCKFWVCGYITDQDDFIPPKCGKYKQMVGHSSDDFCPYGERREVTE